MKSKKLKVNKIVLLILLLSLDTFANEKIKLLCKDIDNESYKQFIEIDKQNKLFITDLQVFDLYEDSDVFIGEDKTDIKNVTTYKLNRYTLELSFYIRNRSMGAAIDMLTEGVGSIVSEKNFFQCKKVEKQI